MIKSVKDLKAYEDVFTLIDECTDNYVFVYDLENDLFHISKSALDTFTLEEEHIKLASSALKPLVYPKTGTGWLLISVPCAIRKKHSTIWSTA